MESIIHSVMKFKVIGPYRLRVFFEDDTYQDIDFRPVLAGRIFSPLKDLSLFNQVSIEDDLLTWPNGAEFSSDTLYNWSKRLPVLREQAREWKRGFKEVSFEDSQQIIFDWDEINELVDGDVEKYKKKIPYFYNAIGRLELDVEIARRLYLLEPHPHIRRRIETLQETIQKIREHLKSCLEEFGDGVEKQLSQYCSTRGKKTKSNLKFENKNIEMEEELQRIEKQLRNSKDEWQWHVTRIITEIPSDHLATYGCIAKIANQCFGHTLISRNVAWLRKHLYKLLTHDTQVPLHRVAKAGDVESRADSEETKEYNDRLRGQEGSLTNLVWWDPYA